MGASLLKYGGLEGEVRRVVMFFVQPVALMNDLERSRAMRRLQWSGGLSFPGLGIG